MKVGDRTYVSGEWMRVIWSLAEWQKIWTPSWTEASNKRVSAEVLGQRSQEKPKEVWQKVG